ncbi:hypothetical protein PHYSODRAFT_521619 [Phytophthora sojae]|uniref:Uncharacterized protein n=1 Tax=Phytophthora sojae (strain P6497) TaxID=1094619 RepID=G5A302_PHYSP|nr:hypothetical protein PHYSODRAFT_521619 [Phytophthora sojae]EGZ10042.1 hypothetical protein PHYSODRAFT_521619 [Phytophthora sojae]|eukprot:XP_009534903.1 hypothetical protein PHYSODRAFT_521619 [Phytophthora sojae]
MCQQWKNRLRDLTKSIYGSRRSLLDTIELRESEMKVRTTTTSNPWSANPLARAADSQEDDPMEEANPINDMLRAIQNTIYAQVEGELSFQLPMEFPVYPDFQTRERLVGAILQGAKRGDMDQAKLTQMLGETKQV